MLFFCGEEKKKRWNLFVLFVKRLELENRSRIARNVSPVGGRSH